MLARFGRREEDKNRRDELLSAYLDGELTEDERKRLETRLSHDAGLRAELRALERTVSLIHQLPQAEAPRNFLVTKSMIRQRDVAPALGHQLSTRRGRSRAWLAPLLTAATAVVSLLFAVVLVGDLFLPGVGGLASAPAPMEQREEEPRMLFEAAPTREMEVESEGARDVASPPAAAPKTAESDAREEPEMLAEEEAVVTQPTTTVESRAGAGARPTSSPEPQDAPTEEGAPLTVPTVEPTVTALTVHTPTIPPKPPVVSEDELGLVEPTVETLQATPRRMPDERESEGLDLPSLPWGVLEIGLGLASLVLVVVTIQAWRFRRD